MESAYLKHIAKSRPEVGSSDIDSPYSFLEWRQRKYGLTEKDAQYHYNLYISEWFAFNKTKPVTQKFALRQKFLYLLDQLALFFSSDEKNAWYEKVNLADEKELLLAIPYFARKLKNITIYYLKLRKKLKNAKVKYNAIGTALGIEQEIYSFLLETFSSANNELSVDLQTIVPSFSGLQQNLTVEVQEMYDDKQYFDVSPTVQLSAYFDVLHEATGKFFATKGLVLSSSEWIFNSFSVPITSTVDSFLSNLTGSIFEKSDSNLYGNFVQKYITENKYNTTFAYVSSTFNTYDVSLGQGNNYFYYPYGTTDKSVSIPTSLKSVDLSSISMEGATAGKTIEEADTMFVKVGDQIKGAWLQYKDFDETLETINAVIKKDKTTSFIFPYPGYGLTAEDIPWTGSSFETTPSYDFLSNPLKALVDEAYWSNSLQQDSCNSLLLNNSTLVESGATSNTDPSQADQFFIRLSRNEDTTIPKGELSGAWLYKFTKTAIPISPNSDNVILWPYCTISAEEYYPSHLMDFSYKDNCNPVSIQELNKSFFIAASSFDLADKIYKLENYADTSDKAKECIWLSGATIKSSNYKYVAQDGFSALFPAGQATRFVWTGPTTPLSAVFTSLQHKKDCPFVTKVPATSSLEWQKCSCKQVYYSPLGHDNPKFEQLHDFADCVICDTENALQPFDFGSWRDPHGLPVLSSNNFAWYQNKLDPCALGSEYPSWNSGSWTTNTTQSVPFKLEPGKAYFYRRAAAKTMTGELPPYVVNHTFNTNRTAWIEAKLNSDGTWSSTNKIPNTVLYPGDLIKYDRQTQTTSYLTTAIPVENYSLNYGSRWATLDLITVDGINNSAMLTWPIETLPYGSADTQYPNTSFVDLLSVRAWSIKQITGPLAGLEQIISKNSIVTFVPPTSGTYSVAVTAVKFGGDEVRIGGSNPTEQTTIPLITAVNRYTEEDFDEEFVTPTSGFLVEHSLKGWDYVNNKKDTKYNGSKPYWAILDSRKNSSTYFKGVYSSGYPNDYVDGYLPDHIPKISPITIQYNTIIEYYRKGYTINWTQPIDFKKFINLSQWSELSSTSNEFSNLSAKFQSKQVSELNMFVNTNSTDIKLTNMVNGYPVEIFYYALHSFVWTVSTELIGETTTPDPALYFKTQTPWTTLTNRFNSTVANVPVLEETYSLEDVGGYFLPNNLGASQFVNKDFVVNLKTQKLSGSYITEETNAHVGGRGRTKQDQSTLFEWTENNEWLKESSTTEHIAGYPKKSLTKTLQTFVPYQSNAAETTLGLITPQSRVSPWGGPLKEEWTDIHNEQKSFTGVNNVSAWVASQTLKNFEKEIDCWSSDIYGNQYGIFKNIKNVPVYERNNVPGELWTKTNSQMVNPGHVSLSAIFNPFKNINTTLYKELTGEGIKYTECYFDTLFIETSSAVIFAKIEYNYETYSIDSVFDDTRYKLLEIDSLRYEANWFFPINKTLISLFTEITDKAFIPVLYEMDLNTRSFKKIFPSTKDALTLHTVVSGISADNIDNGTIYFNSALKTFQLIYTGKNTSNKTFVAAFDLKQENIILLSNINLYLDTFDNSIINEPPAVFSCYLSAINIVKSVPFSVSISATNAPTNFALINYTSQVLANNTGTFSGTLTASGLHHINYIVSNNIGKTINCLTLSAL